MYFFFFFLLLDTKRSSVPNCRLPFSMGVAFLCCSLRACKIFKDTCSLSGAFDLITPARIRQTLEPVDRVTHDLLFF